MTDNQRFFHILINFTFENAVKSMNTPRTDEKLDKNEFSVNRDTQTQ